MSSWAYGTDNDNMDVTEYSIEEEVDLYLADRSPVSSSVEFWQVRLLFLSILGVKYVLIRIM